MPKYVAEVVMRKYVIVEVDAVNRADAWDTFYTNQIKEVKTMYPDLEIAETFMYTKEEYLEEYGLDATDECYLDDITYDTTPDETVIATALYSDGTYVQVEADSIEEADLMLIEEGVPL